MRRGAAVSGGETRFEQPAHARARSKHATGERLARELLGVRRWRAVEI